VRAEILKISNDKPEASLIRYAADQIRAGEVLGMPTDTFYGLAADPFNLRAVDRVYEIKSRSRHKPLSLLIESVEQAEEMARPLPEEFEALARKFWPGPLTIIVKASSRLPLKVTANTGNVALRIPNSRIPLAVVQAAQIPITATSANSKIASRSSWMAARPRAKCRRLSSISPMKTHAGVFCGRAQSRLGRSPSSSLKDE
jgi:L-threonylcarbamoyladenylate synthase